MLKFFILTILITYALSSSFSSILQKISFDLDITYQNENNSIILTSVSSILKTRDNDNKLYFHINYQSFGKISASDDFEANVKYP
jgi:hypothetical protein